MTGATPEPGLADAPPDRPRAAILQARTLRAADVPLYPAAVRQDKCIPRVRDSPRAVKAGRRKGRVRSAGVHERLDSLVALASRIPHLDAHAKDRKSTRLNSSHHSISY